MCDCRSPASWTISSARSVSIARTPSASSASLRPISSVASDLTLITSSVPFARAIPPGLAPLLGAYLARGQRLPLAPLVGPFPPRAPRHDRVRLRPVARPMHHAARPGDRLLQARELLRQRRHRPRLDRLACVPQ